MNPKTIRLVPFRRATAIAVLFSSLFTSLATPAANKYWIGGSDWWDVGTNWSPAGQPLNGDYVYLTQSDSISRTVYYSNLLYPSDVIFQLNIDATGTGNITLDQSRDTLLVGGERVGYIGIGSHSQSGGINTISNSLVLGDHSSGHGTYNLSGSANLTVNSSELIGYLGTGIFNQSGGTNTTNNLSLGYSYGTGNYNLSGGSLYVNNSAYPDAYIGGWGTGIFTHTGGSNTITNGLTLGANSGSSGTYSLSGTGALAAKGLTIGMYGAGNFIQSGGTNTVHTLRVGLGSYNLIDGSLNAVNESLWSSGSSFTQSGGTNTVSGHLDITGYGPAATYNLNGGNLSVNTETIGGGSGVGVMAPGIFNQNGGTHTINQNLLIADNIWSSGTYNLNGGALNVAGNILYGGIGPTSNGVFNLDGGTLNVSGTLIVFDTFRIGNTAGSIGNFTLESGKTLTSANEIIGNAGTGSLTQNGGTHFVTNTLAIAANAGSSGTYNLNDGTLRATTITVNSRGTFNFNGGTLSVDQFNGDLANLGGTLAPGNSPGVTNITGNYSQSETGIFAVEIGGTGLGEFDSLNILGTATLDGTLNVSLFDWGSGLFTPQVGDSFDILTAQILSGQFSTYNLAALGNGLAWNISYLADAIDTTDIVRLSVVSAVPVPPAIWLFGSGLLGLIGIARKRKLH